jgi:hypothetical protein
MPTTTRREHMREGRPVRKHPMRYLTEAQVQAGRGRGVGRVAFSKELLARGLADGYAAAGTWEVERKGNTVTLLHYAFPIATARYKDEVWKVTKVQGRPGFGMSASDKSAAYAFSADLMGYEAARAVNIPKTGVNPDPRLRSAKYGGTYRSGGMGSSVSPYAMVDENRLATVRQFSPEFTPYGPRPAEEQFAPRRGRKE